LLPNTHLLQHLAVIACLRAENRIRQPCRGGNRQRRLAECLAAHPPHRCLRLRASGLAESISMRSQRVFSIWPSGIGLFRKNLNYAVRKSWGSTHTRVAPDKPARNARRLSLWPVLVLASDVTNQFHGKTSSCSLRQTYCQARL
jgi:hypothetical protein